MIKQMYVLFKDKETGNWSFEEKRCEFLDQDTFYYYDDKNKRYKVCDKYTFIRWCGDNSKRKAVMKYYRFKPQIKEFKRNNESYDLQVKQVENLHKIFGIPQERMYQ